MGQWSSKARRVRRATAWRVVEVVRASGIRRRRDRRRRNRAPRSRPDPHGHEWSRATAKLAATRDRMTVQRRLRHRAGCSISSLRTRSLLRIAAAQLSMSGAARAWSAGRRRGRVSERRRAPREAAVAGLVLDAAAARGARHRRAWRWGASRSGCGRSRLILTRSSSPRSHRLCRLGAVAVHAYMSWRRAVVAAERVL